MGRRGDQSLTPEEDAALRAMLEAVRRKDYSAVRRAARAFLPRAKSIPKEPAVARQRLLDETRELRAFATRDCSYVAAAQLLTIERKIMEEDGMAGPAEFPTPDEWVEQAQKMPEWVERAVLGWEDARDGLGANGGMPGVQAAVLKAAVLKAAGRRPPEGAR